MDPNKRRNANYAVSINCYVDIASSGGAPTDNINKSFYFTS